MKHEKIYNAFKAKADFITKFQVIRFYYGGSNDPVTQIVARILRGRYNLPWQEKIIRKACEDAQGKRNAVIDIPQFNYKENVETIFDKFLESKFDKIVENVIEHGIAANPCSGMLLLRDIIERNS